MRKVFAAASLVAIIAVSMVSISSLSGDTFIKAFYDSAPRVDGKVNIPALESRLTGTNANTYNFLIRDTVQDMETLKEFLPRAEIMGIDVWVTIVPPSGLAEERRYDPAYTDYVKIAKSIAELSVEHERLKAWSIDNVLVDYMYFTDSYLENILSAAKEIGPDLMFIPVVYTTNVDSPYFPKRSRHFDGVQFYYTHFPVGEYDESTILVPALNNLKSKYDGKIILGIYATPWSEDYPTSPEYVGQLINLAKQHTDGVMIYTLSQEGEKLDTIKRAFGE